MTGSSNEYNLLLPLIPVLLMVPALYISGMESYDAAFLIVLAPFIAFPTIIIAGQLYNGNETWKNKMKEGGIIGLGALLVSLSVSVWILIE
jgi:hypothetical protein